MGAPSSERARTRAQRVATKIVYKGVSQKLKELLTEDDGWKKLSMLVALAFVISLMSGAWNQPLQFKLFSKPDRDVICNTNFSEVDVKQTNDVREEARKETPHYYVNDPEKLVAYKQTLKREMSSIVNATNLATASDARRFLLKYLPPNASRADENKAFAKLQEYFEEDVELANYRVSIDRAFRIYETSGVLKSLHSADEGNQDFIKVYDVSKSFEYDKERNGKEKIAVADVDRRLQAMKVNAQNVLFGNGYDLKAQLRAVFNYDEELVALLAERIVLDPPETLSEDAPLTLFAQRIAVQDVDVVYRRFHVGQRVVRANQTIGPNEYEWLRTERRNYIEHNRGSLERFTRWFAMFFLTAALLCGSYVFMNARLSRGDVSFSKNECKETAIFLALVAFFFLLGRILQATRPDDGAMLEIIPLLIFVELATFALSWTAAITVAVVLSFALAVSNGGGIDAFVVLSGSSLFVAFAARNVRTRLQLVSIVVCSGMCALILSLSTGFLSANSMRPADSPEYADFFAYDVRQILTASCWRGVCALVAGALAACLLPVVEKYFHVVTPMQLLEYANPSHPLMLELNRRAPATYNHSIQTSTLAEAAAEAIGARAYLAKVGAYFHDVGKMLNPEYFTENQNGRNIHDELEPRMSALVIVAHVKDGGDLGRRYNLPQPIIDLIEQHHGTMLVSFFHQRALKAAQERDPDAKLDEAPFRYPGPIPQSKEAGVLMLADAVESASRSLADWSPRRVESLVRKITEARIEDGQFRDSGLTFGEIQIIQQSLVATLIASRHSRVKYPDDKEPQKDAREESKIVAKEQLAAEKNDDRSSARAPAAKETREDAKIVKRELPPDASSGKDSSSDAFRLP